MKETVDEFTVGFTFQREWVEGKGLLLLIAIYLGGVGGGLFLVSQFLGFNLGLLLGLAIVALGKTGAHLLFLGRPLRFWRAFAKPKTSWLTRGLIGITVFLVFGVLHTAPTLEWFMWLPWSGQTALGQVIQALAALGAFWLIIYTGFLLAASPSIPFWNTSLLPILFVTISVSGGAALIFGMLPFLGSIGIDLAFLETVELWLISVAAIIILAYIWTMHNSTVGGKRAVSELIKGRISTTFLGGVIILGIVIPLLTVVYGYFAALPDTALGIAAICELAGSFLLRYSILKAGIYPPLI